MKNVKIAFLALTAVVCLVTLFIRVPLPSRGYFNFGDVAVVFSGLLLGAMGGGRGVGWAAAAGGVGSAIADVMGGFALFAPITLAAKGAEGALAAMAAGRARWLHGLFLVMGGAAMMGVYFISEALMPNIGLQGAVAEVIPNLIQAAGGIIGGRVTFSALTRMVEVGRPTGP